MDVKWNKVWSRKILPRHKLLLWQFYWVSYQSGLQSLTLWTLLILALSVKTRRKLLFICSFSAVPWSLFGLLFCGALGLSISWFTPWGISSKLGIEEGQDLVPAQADFLIFASIAFDLIWFTRHRKVFEGVQPNFHNLQGILASSTLAQPKSGPCLASSTLRLAQTEHRRCD